MTTKNKTTKEKGTEFEVEFATYMKDELGYKETWLNETVKGRISANEYEVDIIGKKLSQRGQIMKDIGIWLLIVGAIVFGLHFLEIAILVENDMIIFGGLMFFGGLLIMVGKENMYEFTWVECKNWKNRISKTIFADLNSKFNDYHESKDRKRNFKDFILVSGAGFVKNAKRFADEYNIICYERTGENKFKQVWSNKIE